MEIKQMDADGIGFLINEEGIRLYPYPDSAGNATIGIGSTYYESGQKVKMTDPPITHERAIELFRNVLKHYEITVWSVTRDDINQHQFNALVSLCYNIGVYGFKGSTAVQRVNVNPNDKKIRDAFLMWKKSGGKQILLSRRKREASLYFKTNP